MITINQSFKDLIPPLSDDEFEQLKANILSEGCREPLLVWDGVLIDGHNRYQICTDNQIEYETSEIELDSYTDALIWIVHNQFGRRNLSGFARAELALKLKDFIAEKAKGKNYLGGKEKASQNSVEPIDTQKELAKQAGVSHDTIHKVEKVTNQGSDELRQAAREGKVSTNTAATIAELPKDEQSEIIAKGEKEILQKAKEIRAVKAEKKRTERAGKINAISKGSIDLNTDKKYPVIYCDPPWRYDMAETENRAIENHYPTMSPEELYDLPVAEIANNDCVLLMWATSPKLDIAFKVLESWGFTYKTCAVWDKQKIGMGYYFRQSHELLLIATKGDLPTPQPANRPSSVFSYKRNEHSSKPIEVYDMINSMYPEYSKIELFCRTPQDGWDVWGNQSDG